MSRTGRVLGALVARDGVSGATVKLRGGVVALFATLPQYVDYRWVDRAGLG